ncbi:MAG: hypothetical protein U0271_21940 [Polyangiaceae bacterium]
MRSESFAERFEEAMQTGRVLVRRPESEARFAAPFTLACRSEVRILERAIRSVTAFTFVLSTAVGIYVALGAAPRMIGGVVVFWVLSAIAARFYLLRRLLEHGSFLVDFERMELERRELPNTQSAATTDYAIANIKDAAITTLRSADNEAPYWVVLRTPMKQRFRVCRCSEEEAHRVLAVFRTYGFEARLHSPDEDA